MIDSTGTWFELQNSTLQQIEETELMVGDLISYTFSGEISDIEYSDSYCETDNWNNDDIYGAEECWTSYYTLQIFILQQNIRNKFRIYS